MSRELVIMEQAREHTLIIVKTALAEPNASRAGGMMQVSFAEFRAWMGEFRVKRARPGSFRVCGDFADIVESRGCYRKRPIRASSFRPNLTPRYV